MNMFPGHLRLEALCHASLFFRSVPRAGLLSPIRADFRNLFCVELQALMAVSNSLLLPTLVWLSSSARVPRRATWLDRNSRTWPSLPPSSRQFRSFSPPLARSSAMARRGLPDCAFRFPSGAVRPGSSPPASAMAPKWHQKWPLTHLHRHGFADCQREPAGKPTQVLLAMLLHYAFPH